MTGEVPPGSVVDQSVNMIAPHHPGSYRSEWMLSIADDPSGRRWWGFGATGNAPLYALIVGPGSSGTTGQAQAYTSSAYRYTVSYPVDWTAQVNTAVPTGGGSNPDSAAVYPLDHNALCMQLNYWN